MANNKTQSAAPARRRQVERGGHQVPGRCAQLDTMRETLIAWQNLGRHPSNLYVLLHSGRTIDVIKRTACEVYPRFVQQFPRIPSFSDPQKLLINVMREHMPMSSNAELQATAWAAVVVAAVQSAAATPLTQDHKWEGVFLQTPELNLTIMSSSVAHGGALFPLAFPEEGKESDVSDDLFRLNSHDYIGSQIEPAPPGQGYVVVSGQDQQTTVDFLKDPRMGPACQYWRGSDGGF